MQVIKCFGNPQSLLQRVAASGIFGSSKYIDDKDEFVRIAIAKWYNNPGNTVPCETDRHIEAAEQLFDFYVKYRKVATESGLNMGKALHTLYRTGSISEATTALDAIDLRHQQAVALGFDNVGQMNEHQNWLDKRHSDAEKASHAISQAIATGSNLITI